MNLYIIYLIFISYLNYVICYFLFVGRYSYIVNIKIWYDYIKYV